MLIILLANAHAANIKANTTTFQSSASIHLPLSPNDKAHRLPKAMGPELSGSRAAFSSLSAAPCYAEL